MVAVLLPARIDRLSGPIGLAGNLSLEAGVDGDVWPARARAFASAGELVEDAAEGVPDGKIAEEWFCGDYLGMMQQIGAIPALA